MNENERNSESVRVRESVTCKAASGSVSVQCVEREVELDVPGEVGRHREVNMTNTVNIAVRRGEDEVATFAVSLGEARQLAEALHDLFAERQQMYAPASEVRYEPEHGDAALAGEEVHKEVDGLPVHPFLFPERKNALGSVEGLEDEELADMAELERGVILGHWPWWIMKLRAGRTAPGEPWFA